MTATRKTDRFVQRAVIANDPVEAISEYFRSKSQDRRPKKNVEWDEPRASDPSALLVKSCRDLSLAEDELEAKRSEERDRSAGAKERWDEMSRQQLLFRNSFIKFNKFVKENEEKCRRAGRKIAEEKKRRASRQEQMDRTSQELERIERVRDEMRARAGDYEIYRGFLERAVSESSGEFQNIGEIFDRYESLVESRNALARRRDENLEALESTALAMQRMTEAKGETLVELNEKSGLLRGRYERAKAGALKWQTIVSRIKGTAASKSLELARVKSACWNMYEQMSKRKGCPIDVARDDVESQLAHIKRTIVELKRITKTARKRAALQDRASLF